MRTFSFKAAVFPSEAAELRREVRSFLEATLGPRAAVQCANSWTTPDRAFSRAAARAGYVGMTWPKRYGGRDRAPIERYIVLEEMIAAGAPMGAHLTCDRQTGPLILQYGTESQKKRWLPAMARADLVCCIGLSEPGAGSDLAAVQTTAERTAGGWRLNGQKVWTTSAHVADYMLTLVRSDKSSVRHRGLSQFMIPLCARGVSVKPIRNLAGQHEFNEVFLDDVCVTDDALVGTEGEGWKQVTSELALERSGPERYLSSYALFVELLQSAGGAPPESVLQAIGRATAELWTLRQMSIATLMRVAAGEDAAFEAAAYKDLANSFEQSLPQLVLGLLDDSMRLGASPLRSVLELLLQVAPSFSLRGGTREIMRGIVARELGLR